MKKLTVLLLAACLLIAPACGGGGTTTPGDNNDNGDDNPTPPDPTARQRTQQMLEDCEIEQAIAFARDIIGFLRDLTDGSATAAGFSANSANFSITDQAVMLPWDLDIDGGGTDATGIIQFFDNQQMPVNPALPLTRWNPLAGGDLDTLQGILAGPPPPADGTSLFTSFDGTAVIVASGQLGAFYNGGTATTTTGSSTATLNNCNVQIQWTAQLMNGFPAAPAFPTGTVNGTITAGGDTIVGDITMNGTATATTMMTINGGETNTFQINLTTGAITLVP